MIDLIKSVKVDEGFCGTPYIDPLVVRNPESRGISKYLMEQIQKVLPKLKLTFGYGFTFITDEEAETILRMRIEYIRKRLAKKINGFYLFPPVVQDMFVEMAFQLGVEGTLKFKKMIKAVKNHRWNDVIKEAKNSAWYRQTPHRVKKVVFDRIRSLDV